MLITGARALAVRCAVFFQDGCPQLWIGLCPHVDVREFPGRSARSQAPTIGSESTTAHLWRAKSELAELVLSVFSGDPLRRLRVPPEVRRAEQAIT